jgi:hypothetical protein
MEQWEVRGRKEMRRRIVTVREKVDYLSSRVGHHGLAVSNRVFPWGVLCDNLNSFVDGIFTNDERVTVKHYDTDNWSA